MRKTLRNIAKNVWAFNIIQSEQKLTVFLFISPDTSYQYELQHHKIRRRYGVLRRADISPLSRDCLFLLRKDIGGSWQRFHRRKCRVGGSLADGRDGDGEGGVRRDGCIGTTNVRRNDVRTTIRRPDEQLILILWFFTNSLKFVKMLKYFARIIVYTNG